MQIKVGLSNLLGKGMQESFFRFKEDLIKLNLNKRNEIFKADMQSLWYLQT